MVGAGVGLGMVPLGAVSAGVAHAPLAVVELEEPWAQRDLKVCVRKRESLPRFAAELVAFLAEGRVGPT
ncbi:LysR substrate binding domain protein [compost metagenome]